MCKCVCVCPEQSTTICFDDLRAQGINVCYKFSQCLGPPSLLRPLVDQGQVPADGERGVNSGGGNKVDLTSVKDLVLGI